MYKQDLFDYLDGKLDAKELEKKIEQELAAFKRGLSERGRSAPIVYHGDKEKVHITKTHLNRIQKDFAENNMDQYFRSYIVDALLLSENSIFESEELEEGFEGLSL